MSTKAEIDRLRLKALEDDGTLLTLEEANARLRTALEWYADPVNYALQEPKAAGLSAAYRPSPPIMKDGGGQARKALANEQEKTDASL